MAARERLDQRSPAPKFKLNGHHFQNDNDINSDVENLKESLKNGLFDARKKITHLRKELKEKNESLEHEKELRSNAEKELVEHISMDTGIRGNLTPSPTMIRSQLQSPMLGTRSSTPKFHLGSMESMIEELKSARLLNRTLTEKLSKAETELDRALLSKDEMQIELEASVTARGAALVDKLYSAQKVREESMITRMQLMCDEKEDLLKRIEKLEKNYGNDSGVENGYLQYDGINPKHMSLNEVVGKIPSENHPDAIEYHGDVIAERLTEMQHSSKRKSQEDYLHIKRERDEANKRLELLQEEIRDLNHERELYETQHRQNEKNRLKALQNQLKSVISERDKALENADLLQEELEKIRLQFSLKNSLSQEDALCKQFNTTLGEFETKLEDKESQLILAQQTYDETIVQLKNTLREKNEVEAQLKSALAQVNIENKRAEKSERLVAVLQRRKAISISDTID